MARGFLSGVMMGGAVSLVGAGTLSVIAGLPEQPAVEAEAPQPTNAPETSQTRTQAPAGDADLVTEEAAPQVETPKPDDTEAASLAGQDTAPVPETGNIGDRPATEVQAQEAEVTLPQDEPVLPSPQAALPSAPGGEVELSISTDPAQPPAPPVDDAFAPTPSDDELETPSANFAAAPVDSSPSISGSPALTEQPGTDVAALVEQDGAAPQQEVEGALRAQDENAAAPEDGTPQVGRPANSLIERTGEAEPEALAAPEEPAQEIDMQGRPPIEFFAVEFENTEDKPLMSIVLIDTGAEITGGEIGVEALRSFPYPLSFAVDVNLPDAKDRMNAYRKEGFEVLAMLNLPEGATAEDAEVNLAVAFDKVPEAVGLIEGTGSGLQASREAADQVIAALKDSGHGFVLQAKGLNTIHKLAQREGLPTALVFRDFDSAGQTPTVIRRFLDQAAFRARQEGGVIMMGRLRPDTISALLLWGLQDRARRVALAPVSATLLNKAGLE